MSSPINPVFIQSGGASGGGSGTVTSVAATGDGTVLASAVGGSPVTTAGTLALSLANAGANTVLGNATGSPAAPAYGQIVNAQITNSTIDLTAKVTGVLPVANGGVAVVSTSANGGVWGGLGIGQCPFNGASNAAIASNNQVRYLRFVLPYKVTITKLSAQGGASNGWVGDFGIYSADGTTLLANTGAVTYGVNTIVTTTIAQTTVTLNPGIYTFAYTATLSTATIYTIATNTLTWQANSTAQFGIAGNAATAGALPSSLGTLTRSAAISNYPAVFFEP